MTGMTNLSDISGLCDAFGARRVLNASAGSKRGWRDGSVRGRCRGAGG